MKQRSSEQSQICLRLFKRISSLSMFWRVLLLMLCLTCLLLVALDCSRRTAEKALRENYMKQAQIQLQRNCQTMTTALYNTYAIPTAIEDSQYFNYIRTENSGVLPQKYVSVLSALRSALSNQMFLQRTSEECVLYFSGPNCIVTKQRVFSRAEDCFNEYLYFSEKNNDEILGLLKQKNSLMLLPAQQIQIGTNNEPELRMAFIVRPFGSSVAVMTIYDLQTILDYLGMGELPEGTVLSIDSTSGENLLRYPQDAEPYAQSHSVSAKSAALRCVVTVSLPESWFTDQLRPTQRINLLLSFLFCLLSVWASVLLSRISIKPVTKLVENVPNKEEISRSKNEVQFLSALLEHSKQERENLQSLLLSNLLSRALSGVILSAEEECQLQKHLGTLCSDYRVAIIYTETDFSQLQLTHKLCEKLPAGSVCQPIGLTQTGAIFRQQDEVLRILEEILTEIAQQEECTGLLCGVSSKMHQLSELHIAVRQARLAVPEKGIVGVYTSNPARSTRFSWLQHERLYQCVLSADEEGCEYLLRSIVAEPMRASAAREIFYNISFVLHSAAEEMELPVQKLVIAYDVALPPKENFKQLEDLLHQLFHEIRQQRSQQQSDENHLLLEYLGKQFADPACCAASVARDLNMTEKRVYTLVRKVTDRSFGEYLLQLRMLKAADLLCTTSLGAAEIAEQCGYLAVNTFYRAFRKYYDMTPSQFRKNAGTGQHD